jgi:exodeoxyribonuclease VII large subunit
VARALAASRVPTISAVGHETDYTIADFVADLRAPTPSAAAEHVIQAKDEIGARIDTLARRQHAAMILRLARIRSRVGGLASHRVFEAERGRLRNQAQRVDELRRRAETGLRRRLERARDRLRGQGQRVEAFRLDRQSVERRERVARQGERLRGLATAAVEAGKSRFSRLAGKLDTLSPLAVLSRGYALVWNEDGRLVREPAEARLGEALRIRVRGGALGAVVTSREEA